MMDRDLIGPTATLTAALLAKVQNQHSEFTKEIIASAFEDAYWSLKAGIARVDEAERKVQAARLSEMANHLRNM